MSVPKNPMNYLILRSIVEATLTNFRCQNCSGSIEAKDLTILGTSGASLNMEVQCPHCKTIGVIKAEVNVLGALAKNLEVLQNLKHLGDAKNKLGSGIKDEDIVSLRDSLNQKGTSAADFFS